MAFVLPRSPNILRQDRFDLVPSKEAEVPFGHILTSILTESLDSVVDTISFIDVLKTLSVILHGKSKTDYAFLKRFLDNYQSTTPFFTFVWPRLAHLALEL